MPEEPENWRKTQMILLQKMMGIGIPSSVGAMGGRWD